MATPKITEEQICGFRLFEPLRRFLDRLHQAGTQRDRAGNRELFFDQYICLLLLYFFNPIVSSLRGIQQITTLEKVQRTFGIGRFSLGSLSEAARIFDASLLREIVSELSVQAKPLCDSQEAKALQALTAVDGSLLPALPKMAWALWQDDTHRAARMHVHLDVFCCVPVDATVTEGNGSETQEMAKSIRAGRLYVLDRGYAKYKLFQDIVDAHASFVARVQENAAYRVIETRPISTAAANQGVVLDVVVDKLGSEHHKNEIHQSMRLVKVATGKTNQDGSPDMLVLCTDRLDLDPELLALAYKYRWQVELFFRWLKCILGCRHLISLDANGVAIQVYAALIASLLLALYTKAKPNKRTFEMLCYYFIGMATEKELWEHLAKKIGK